MTGVITIAVAELKIGLRNRWVLMASLFLAGLALALAFIGAAPGGTVEAGRLTVTSISLASLATYLIPLIALLLAYDAIVGEIDRGTMLLLLSYPIARHAIVLGKFLGQLAVVAIATVIGFCVAAAAIALTSGVGPGEMTVFLRLLGSSVLLGAAFVALGHLASCLVRDRSTAAGIAIAIWLVMVLLWDMGLLGLLVADEGGLIAKKAFAMALIVNPADSYRLFNLTGLPGVEALSGMGGVQAAVRPDPLHLLASLGAWIVLPLMLTASCFARREL